MIPLSNGRSPRVDQFYATLRAIKSHQIDQDSYQRSEQDRSIQYIRSLGKEILDNQPTNRKISLQKEVILGLNKSTQSIAKPKNLYDKYKQEANKKKIKQMNNTKQQIIKQQLNTSPQKLKKDKKYESIPSKIETKPVTKQLNYIKKAYQQAQKIRKQKIQSQKFGKQIKKTQQFYERNSRFANTLHSKQLGSGLLRRAQQLHKKKQQTIQRIRTEQYQKQMQKVTFQPIMISKKSSTLQPNFQKRNSMNTLQKLSKQKQILKQTVLQYSFTPMTNQYKQADSKVAKIWKQTREEARNQSFQRSHPNLNMTQTMRLSQSAQNEYKSQRTANSTTQINLKNLNQISFIFE